VQWVVGAYTLAFAVALVLGGRLGDKYGRRNLFLVGAAGFTLASLACATAQEPTFLIAARAAQGFLGALLIPQGFGIMKEVFPPQDLGKAFASFGPVIGPAVAGPLLGASSSTPTCSASAGGSSSSSTCRSAWPSPADSGSSPVGAQLSASARPLGWVYWRRRRCC
jgi:MFS family permease